MKETVFQSTDIENKNSRKAASASFFKILGGGSKHGKSVTESELQHYEDNRTHSEIITFGGPVFLYVSLRSSPTALRTDPAFIDQFSSNSIGVHIRNE